MIGRIKNIYQQYPRQFWLMFIGILISTIGGSMILPFLMIYFSETLEVKMTIAASMMTINSGAGIVAAFIAGPIIDRVGRKWIMVFSLFLNGLAYLFLSYADTLPIFALLMAVSGIAQPLYRIGGDAMLADLLTPDKRADGYALLRLSNNLGVAIGPAIGGFLAATSYSLAFYGAAIGMAAYGLLLAIFAIETLPDMMLLGEGYPKTKEPFGGYISILRDFPFISFAFAYTLVIMVASLMWVLLPVYVKQNFQITENIYGWIPTTNALMVVTLQVSVTKITKRYQTLPVLATGAAIYTIAISSIVAGTSFWSFWASIVIMTIGELILVPTASTYAANLAPTDKRGRYMSIFGMAWRIAIGIGPFLGGLLNDNIGPYAIWIGGAAIGFTSTILFLTLKRMDNHLKQRVYTGL